MNLFLAPKRTPFPWALWNTLNKDKQSAHLHPLHPKRASSVGPCDGNVSFEPVGESLAVAASLAVEAVAARRLSKLGKAMVVSTLRSISWAKLPQTPWLKSLGNDSMDLKWTRDSMDFNGFQCFFWKLPWNRGPKNAKTHQPVLDVVPGTLVHPIHHRFVLSYDDTSHTNLCQSRCHTQSWWAYVLRQSKFSGVWCALTLVPLNRTFPHSVNGKQWPRFTEKIDKETLLMLSMLSMQKLVVKQLRLRRHRLHRWSCERRTHGILEAPPRGVNHSAVCGSVLTPCSWNGHLGFSKSVSNNAKYCKQILNLPWEHDL